ncbi:hypothetical protein WA158_002956 [Blastocystis sp. Blastoise]
MEKYNGYLGLLKWSLAQSDGTSPTSIEPMTEDKKEFLDNAMKEALVSDADKMKNLLKKLEDHSIDYKTKTVILEDLEEFGQSIDNSIDFNTIGGFKTLETLLKDYLENENEEKQEMIKQICSLIAVLSENNPKIQNIIIKSSLFTELYTLKDTLIPELQTASLSAISAIIRGNKTCELYFIAQKGLLYLSNNLQSNNKRLVQKSIFLLTVLSSSHDLSAFLSSDHIYPSLKKLFNDKEYESSHDFIQQLLKLTKRQ